MAYFNNFIPSIQEAEGGFQKIPSDPGNYNSLGQLVGTNRGVSARTYETIIGRPPTEQDMRNISKQEALSIFEQLYWNKLHADQINSQAVAETLADFAINAGPKRAVKLMQELLNSYFGYNLQVDGIIGPKTLNAINSVDEAKLFDLYNRERADYYQSLSNFNIFGRSWLQRIYNLIEKYPNLKSAAGFGSLFALLFALFILYKKSQ